MAAPLRALRLLTAEYGHLPAPTVQVSTVYPDRLELTFHDDLSDFEAWRGVLGIAPSSVEYGEQSDGRTRVLRAQVDYAGALLRLTGYATIYEAATVGGAA
ncbi:hypothetical protein H1V43_34175 [Streptomyces sp. PSKA54]|uniref:Uncharacterized protein n=2 Tax=Streptomyces TaxID=1883 RepID=A0A7W2HJM4_9ACTN|nr:hypothetical protein [Streptomyces himalayensis subsp. aureolus]